MTPVEFYEAIARLSEECCLPPLKGLYQDIEISLLEQRMKIPLCHKMEGIIVKLY